MSDPNILDGSILGEKGLKERVGIKTFRVMRGRSCEIFMSMVRSSSRDWMQPPMSFTDGGFRVGRTIP